MPQTADAVRTAEESAEVAERDRCGTEGTILVVDDNLLLRDALAEMLR
jgi:hypothetical protein